MAAISIEAGNGTLKAVRAFAVVAVMVAGAGLAQAADSSDRIIPPSAADVAILRGLLALQHPALRQGGMTAPAAAASAPTVPAVTTEPGQKGKSAPATEGEACVSPNASGATACGYQIESSTARLGSSFRASLERSMAAAGFDSGQL